MLPPTVVGPPATEVLIWLLMRCTISVASSVMFPPEAFSDSVVTDQFVLRNCDPALVVILPASPLPALAADIVAPSLSVMPAVCTLMLPPAPVASAFENKPLLGPVSVTGPVVLIVSVPPLP